MSKALAHEAMERNLSLYEVASQAETIASYWAKFTDSEKELIRSPETNYTGLDPEADESGNEFFRYPVGKSITFGVDVTF